MMSQEYKGIKIPKEILIVENSNGQGYVVEKGNDKMLENAIQWGTQAEWQLGKYYKTIKPNIYEYENGNFEFALNESAGYSANSGKLSFWNCDVTAPDGKVFKIGINSDILLKLLKVNTFINGKCQSKVYLGREKTNVGVYTTNMEDYKQAIQDQNKRDSMSNATNKYKVGDIVGGLNYKQLYLGEAYKLIDDFSTSYRSYSVIQYKNMKEPKKVHVFLDLDRFEKYPNYSMSFEFLATKPKKLILGQDDAWTLEKAFEYNEKYFDNDLTERERTISSKYTLCCYLNHLYSYAKNDNQLNDLIEKAATMCRKHNCVLEESIKNWRN